MIIHGELYRAAAPSPVGENPLALPTARPIVCGMEGELDKASHRAVVADGGGLPAGPSPSQALVGEQALFPWAAKPVARSSDSPPPSDRSLAKLSPRATNHLPGPDRPEPAGYRSRIGARPKLRALVEQLLKDRRVPYVDVHEARNALCANTRLRVFHFVVYQKNGLNWLLLTTQLRRETRQDMIGWEKIFGPGFVAVVASQTADAQIRFRKLDGEAISLE